jgi:acyl-coenzyme A synthetase/AMP-(fatty) acid ligase
MGIDLLGVLEKYSERPCLAAGDRVFTYADLLDGVQQAEAVCEAKGIYSGDVVLLVGNYDLNTISWFLTFAKLGCVVVPSAESVPTEEQLLRQEISKVHWRIGADTQWRLEQITIGERPQLYEKLGELGHAGLILFSSGSTGAPKAMVHDLTIMLNRYVHRHTKSLPVMAALLFDHIGGLNTLWGALASGQLLVSTPSHDPDIVALLISRYKVAVLPTTPTFLNLLLMSGAAERHDLSSLRVISYGTEPMTGSLLQKLRLRFPRVKFVETFGTSETGIAKTKNNSGNTFRLDDADVEWRAVDGELWLRSKTQILGYLNHDMNRFTDDGWFRTGDRVEVRADGAMHVMGRENDWINVGGEKVFPVEVEAVILEIPLVVECRVRGEPNPITGQSVVAEVVFCEKAGDVDSARREIRKYCRNRLEAFKVPTRILPVQSLPVSARGKRMRN